MYKSATFAEKRQRKPETGIKYGFEEMDREFRPGETEIPLLPEIFRWNDPESRARFTFQPDFADPFCKW